MCSTARPQLTAFFTSSPILASSAAVNAFSAKATGHRAPSSRFALSLKPNVAYLVLNLCAGWKKQTTLPSLAYAGIPYQSFGERAGALALTIAWSRSPRARSGAGISPIFASTALSPSALSAFSSWTRSLIAPRSSFVNPLIAFAGFFVAFLSTLSSVDMRWSPFCCVGQGKRVFPFQSNGEKTSMDQYNMPSLLSSDSVVYPDDTMFFYTDRLLSGIIWNKEQLSYT